MSQTPEQIADDMLKDLSSTDTSAVYPYVVGLIGSIVENADRSDAECRDRIRASLAAADIVRQRLIDRQRAPQVTPRIDTEDAARTAFGGTGFLEDDDNEWGGA